MTSPFANIFIALQAQIAAALAPFLPSGSQPYIDMDYGQLEHKERPMVAFPCILIKFPDWNFKDMAKAAQEASGNIILKVADDPVTATTGITPAEYIEAGLKAFEMEQALFVALDNRSVSFTADNSAYTTRLSRVSSRPDSRRPGLNIREITYSCSFQDYSATPAPETINVPISLTTSFSFPG
jgi:hypothetical protein